MLNYIIIFKECLRTAQLIRFKVCSFVTPFPNTEVSDWGVTPFDAAHRLVASFVVVELGEPIE